MELTPVKSSHVATIDYVASHRLLLVSYKDGSLYAWPDIGANEWGILQAQPSKGKWVNELRLLRAGIKIANRGDGNGGDPLNTGGESRAATQSSANDFPVEHSASGAGGDVSSAPLNVIDENASKCCRRGIKEAFGAKTMWSCSDCGTDFRAEAVGITQYWRIVPRVAVLRRKQ